MRNYLLLLFLILTVSTNKQVSAQSYNPLLEDSTTWDTWSYDNSPLCNFFPHDRSFLNGDTIINATTYKRISGYWGYNISPCTIWAFDNTFLQDYAFLREDTTLQQVWSYSQITGEDILLFDFSLVQGDTLVTSFNMDLTAPDSLLVDSTGSIQLQDGSFRKIIYLSWFINPFMQEFIIEGIGGSCGMYLPPMNYGIDFGSALGCVLKNNIEVLGNTSNLIPYVFDYCPFVTGVVNTIEGTAFIDLNSNQVFDSGDQPYSHKKIAENNTGIFDFTDANGYYKLYIPDTGNFAVQGIQLNNYTSQPINHSASFSAFLQTDSLNDFAYQPLSIFDDLEIYLITGRYRSGMTAGGYFRVINTGSTTQNPIIVYHPGPNLQYNSASITPSQVTPDSILWNLSGLAPFQYIDIYVSFLVDAGLPIGTPISSYVEVFPMLNDFTVGNNIDSVNAQIVTSFDPNDISVNRDTLYSTEMSNPPFLNYQIRFQNTGNDTAFVVRVENLITPNLEASSFEFISASHPVTLHWDHILNQVEFNFANILLPDSNTNEPESHGYIRYKIKPKNTLSPITYIYNRASIYFDLNLPVLTNNVYTILIEPTGLPDYNNSDFNFSLFPNPFQNELNLHFAKGVSNIQMLDLSGRIVLELPQNNLSNEVQINTEKLSKGIYLIKLTGENSIALKKGIKF